MIKLLSIAEVLLNENLANLTNPGNLVFSSIEQQVQLGPTSIPFYVTKLNETAL